jgi:hypothetical protein
MRGAVAAAAASPVLGLMGLLLVVVAAVVLVVAGIVLLMGRLWARPLVVLRRRRELALLGAPAARVRRRAAAAVGPPLVVPLLRLPAAARGRRPRRRRRGDAHHGPLLGVVGVERPVQRRRGGALVLAHLVEVDRVPDIVLVPGAELGHGRPFLQVRTSRNEQSKIFSKYYGNANYNFSIGSSIITRCLNVLKNAIKSHSDSKKGRKSFSKRAHDYGSIRVNELFSCRFRFAAGWPFS